MTDPFYLVHSHRWEWIRNELPLQYWGGVKLVGKGPWCIPLVCGGGLRCGWVGLGGGRGGCAQVAQLGDFAPAPDQETSQGTGTPWKPLSQWLFQRHVLDITMNP